MPGMLARERKSFPDNPLMGHPFDDQEYRDVEYVKEEIRALALQLAKVTQAA